MSFRATTAPRVLVPMPCRRPLSITPRSPSSVGALLLPEGVTPAEVRDCLSGVLRSKPFASSRRMVRFLEFVVEELLRGRSGELKELVIGLNVFDRGPQYDPQCDPIVRVEARRLRTKLRAYYSTEGQHDRVRFTLPKGGYAPRIDTPAAAESAALASELATVVVAPFQMLTPLDGGANFAEGLNVELIHALTRVPGIRVIAGKGAELFSLCGSVRGAAQRLRITAHLVNTATGHFVWSDTYDRLTDDPFAVQEEVARAVAVSLGAALGKRQG